MNLQHFQQLAQDREDSLRLLNKPSMRGIRASIVEKYSEKAHFIYELLQNADDVGATQTWFKLRRDGLYFGHNGTVHFTVTPPDDLRNIGHINAITAIGDSTKLDGDAPKIGKFGVGFKAVFQYTNTPHVYDPSVSFKIRDLIVPVLLPHEPHPLREKDETLFYFPFDRLEKTADEAVSEIEEKLKNLLFPLLFLRNLKKISWENEKGLRGNYETQGVPHFENVAHLIAKDGQKEGENSRRVPHFQSVAHVSSIGKKTIRQAFLRFEKAVSDNQTVQVVYFLSENNSFLPKKMPAFCFFPTKVEAGLRFAVHAPFLLNDNREGVKRGEKWNENLVRILAETVAESLETISDFKFQVSEDAQNPKNTEGGYLAEFFQILPLDRSEVDPLFVPISDALIQKLHQKALIPAENGEKVVLSKAYLAENEATREQFGMADLEQVFGEGARWIFPNLSHHSKFFQTIKSHLTANKSVVNFDFLHSKLAFFEKNKEKTTENATDTEGGNFGELRAEVIEIYDTLSDEERQKLMQSVEPNAIYAAWEEVLDYDIVGLENYLAEPFDLEKSVALWTFLANCFDHNVLNNNNLEGTYSFAFQTEKTVGFEALWLRRLKNTAWIFDENGNFYTPQYFEGNAELQFRNWLQTGGTGVPRYHERLLQCLFSKTDTPIDRFAYLTDGEKQAIEIGKRFLEQGFSTDDLLELRRIKAARVGKERVVLNEEKPQKERKKREKPIETEEIEQVSSAALLQKQQELREELEAELEEKIAELVEVEALKQTIAESERYSTAWFRALLRLEYLLAYEKQNKDKSLQIHFDKIEREANTDKTILLRRPSKPLPLDIEEAQDMSLKIQLEHERRSLAVEVVSRKDAGLRAKLKSPNEIVDVDFGKIRGATLEIQNTIFVLEELTKSFEDLELDDDFNYQTQLTPNLRFIFGPPGTGKTTYLAQQEIQPAMLGDAPLKVLVLTPTNKAADVLVKKVQQTCGDTLDWLMRFGTTADMSIENAGLLKDSTYNLGESEHFCVVTTITRFPYDGFNNGSWDYKFKNIPWDVIIVDEASMISLPYIAYLLERQKQAHFVIGGDPFQIEPVVFAEDWQGENIYSLVRLDAFDPVLQRERLFPHPYTVTNLTTQYRSLNTIGSLYSHFAYDSILRHARFKEQRLELDLPDLPLKDINLIHFPVQKMESIYRPQLLNKSHFHVYSALLTVELAHYLAKNLQNQAKNHPLSIGIICPYKAQATLVDKVMASLHLNFKNITIQTGTIHSFQGDECNIVLCLLNPPPTISKSPNAFLNKKNILNVAMSRAKDRLILLLPDDHTEGVENLYQINRVKGIVQYYLAGVRQRWTSAEVEEILFGQADFLYENSFVTTHQSVNVYTAPEKKYEIRIEEQAIDVQVRV